MRAALWQQICTYDTIFLRTTDLPAAYHIEQRAHALGEETFASNQGEALSQLSVNANGKMAAFAITQVVLDEATLFNIAVDPDSQRQGLGRALLEHLIDELENGVATHGWKSVLQTLPPLPTKV